MNAFRIIGLLLLMLAQTARADSWLPPTQQQIVSADGLVRVTVTPRPLAGALPYFQDKVDGKAPAGQREGSDQTTPMALLERKDAEGRWQVAWTGPLVNDVAPVSVLVASSGRLVTFDNWHSRGFGDDVVVIYDEHGKVVRKIALKDFLPSAYIVSLPLSASSLHWSTDNVLIDSDRTVELHVLEPGAKFAEGEPRIVPLRISMADGHLLAEQDASWKQALDKVAVLDAERRVRWEALRARRAAPLAAPAGSDTKAWRDYMVELRERLNQTMKAQHAGAVLPANGKGDYPDSADAIADMVQLATGGKDHLGKQYLFVSARSEALAQLLAKNLRTLEPNSLKDVHISFVGTPAQADALKPIAERTGATIHVIDQAQSYPGQQLPSDMPEWFD